MVIVVWITTNYIVRSWLRGVEVSLLVGALVVNLANAN